MMITTSHTPLMMFFVRARRRRRKRRRERSQKIRRWKSRVIDLFFSCAFVVFHHVFIIQIIFCFVCVSGFVNGSHHMRVIADAIKLHYVRRKMHKVRNEGIVL